MKHLQFGIIMQLIKYYFLAEEFYATKKVHFVPNLNVIKSSNILGEFLKCICILGFQKVQSPSFMYTFH